MVGVCELAAEVVEWFVVCWERRELGEGAHTGDESARLRRRDRCACVMANGLPGLAAVAVQLPPVRLI